MPATTEFVFDRKATLDVVIDEAFLSERIDPETDDSSLTFVVDATIAETNEHIRCYVTANSNTERVDDPDFDNYEDWAIDKFAKALKVDESGLFDELEENENYLPSLKGVTAQVDVKADPQSPRGYSEWLRFEHEPRRTMTPAPAKTVSALRRRRKA